MVDQERVCCLCGDVGFADRLFQCSRCRFRFQHSYCSNYYCGIESSSTVCDWCESEERNSSSSSSKHAKKLTLSSSSSSDNNLNRSEYTVGERIKHQKDHKVSSSAAKNSGVPSPRQGSHRRYKLLKDVMC